MKKEISPKAGPAWRCIWISLIMLAGVAVLSSLKLGGTDQPTEIARILTSGFMFASWLLIIRFLLLDTWGKKFWGLILILTLVSTIAFGKASMVMGIVASILFLFSRPFNSWRLVSPQRRAVGFGLGILALVVIFGATGVWSTEADDRSLNWLDRLGVLSLSSLMAFWFLSLFHLAVRMRLHFLRLRAKLAASAILIGMVPLVLVAVLGSMAFFWGLGGARALRTTNIIESWRMMADQGTDLAGAPFDTTFAWPDSSFIFADPSFVTVDHPEWAPELATILGSIPNVKTKRDTTEWYLMDQEIWLIRLNNAGLENAQLTGWKLTDKPLLHLSYLTKTGVEVGGISTLLGGSGINFSSGGEDQNSNYPSRRVCYRPIENGGDFWNMWRSFGVSLFALQELREGEITPGHLVVNLAVGWTDLKTEFLEGDNNLNLVMFILLATVGFLFLTIEIFAFFFGVRITEGFVGAVHALHKGTRALGEGNLDVVIDIPNEDEFGDLADSFNETIVAIRQGREDALAKERLTREMETARGIQNRLLPSEEPALRGFEVAGASIPSREVGGDYFDFLIQDTDRIGVAIGDVSGKGMPAALLMSNLQASLHGQVIHPSSVAEVVGLVNDLIVASTDAHMFATFFYGLLDTQAGTFTSTNAGHNPPLLLRADGTLEELKTGGLLLGMLSQQEYKQETVQMNPGDVIVLYTDGITEAVGPAADEDDIDAMFGEEALEEVVRRSSQMPATGIKESILTAVSQHTEGVAQSDDITLVVIRRQD
ncbi:MAG: SpoIIE family protein phosphatase [bacterium]|nr:SpoIIE family protein phosphatase [bacterium]